MQQNQQDLAEEAASKLPLGVSDFYHHNRELGQNMNVDRGLDLPL